VLPFYQQNDIPLLRVLTDRGTEYCGVREHHEYQLYLAIEDIDHSKTKARSPQTMGFVSVFIKPFRMSFTQLLLERKYIAHWKNCRKT
jgi:hypothetical protein